MKKIKIGRVIFALIVVIVILSGILFFLFQPRKTQKPAQKVEIVDQIEAYGYHLDNNETNYYQSLFQNLKKVLDETKVDEKEYASYVSQLFLADFFNLNNKISKNDIGGTQFVYESYQNDFNSYAQGSIYHTIQNNLYDDRTQELPVVTKVSVKDIKQESFSYGAKKDAKAYYVVLTIEYQKDMGYQTECELILIHNDKKLEIAKMGNTKEKK